MITVHAVLAEQTVAGSPPIDTIVVTASRLPTAATSVTASVEVIESDQIESRNSASVVELLRQIAGVNVSQQGGRGGVTDIIVRGGESNFTVVLIDGVKVNDPTNSRGGSYDFSGLDLAGVTRVELVRGPLSSVYGSDALAGVIQVITTQSEPGGAIQLQTGGDDFSSAAISFAGKLAATILSMNLHAAQDDLEAGGSSYEDRGVNASMQSDLSERSLLALGLRLQQAQSSRFPEDSGGAILAVIRDLDHIESEELHLWAAWDYRSAGGWNFRVAGSRYKRNEDFSSPGIAPGALNGVPAISADTEFSRNQLITTVSRHFGESTTFLAGAEWQREKGTSVGFLDPGFPLPTDFRLQRDTLSTFAEVSVKTGPVVLQGSVRRDDFDSIGNETTLRVGALYRFSDGKSELRLNAGQGFKAPGFFGLAHPLIGNPLLRPESAESVDIMFTRRIGSSGGEIGIGWYGNEYEDLVDFDPNQFRLVNRASVVADGYELLIAAPLADGLDLKAHVSYSDTEIRGSDAQLRGRPKWRGGIIVDWSVSEAWQVTMSALYLDDFYESSIPTGSILLDGYERVDLAASWQASERFTWRFAVDNLLDAGYQEAVGFPAPGIRGRIGIRYTF